jgi:hypothetical protein
MRFQTRHAIRSLLAACAMSRRQPPAPRTNGSVADHQATGAILAVDPIGRELSMDVDGATVTFYVPLDCSIILNDERVKLRLLQPMDRAVVRYTNRCDHPIAYSILVDWKSHHADLATQESSERPAAELLNCT